MSGRHFRVYSFRRWSTVAQNESDSDRRQLHAALDYCEKRGWSLDEQLIDPGKSAYHGRHMLPGGSLRRFFDMIQAGTVRPGDKLIFEGWDRYSRQPPRIAMPLFFDIVNAGVEVHLTDANQALTKKNIDENESLLFGVLVGMQSAHRESRIKASRVRDSWAVRRNTKTKVCPDWMRLVSDEYKISPVHQAALIRMCELAVAGHGVNSITRTLNADPVFGDGFGGKGWFHSYVRTLLTDRRLIGEVEFNRIEVDEATGKRLRIKTGERRKIYPAAVSEELWTQVQAVRRRDWHGRNGATLANLFGGGLAKCACGSSMIMVRRGRPGKYYDYLQCVDAGRKHKCTASKMHPYVIIEQFVLLFFGTLAYGDIGQDETTSTLMVQKAKAQREADDIEAAYHRILDAVGIGQGGLAAKRLAALEDDHKAAVGRVRAIERQLAELSTRPLGERLSEVQKLIANMDQLDGAERVAVRSRINRGLGQFIEKIVFNDSDPPAHAVRPADYVQANEWYIRFRRGWPSHLPIHSPDAKMLAAMMGKTTVRDGEVTIEVPGRR